MSDAEATVHLARRALQKQPALFEECLRLRNKRVATESVCGTFLYVSGSLQYHGKRATVLTPVSSDEKDNVYAVDLSYSPDTLLPDSVQDGASIQVQGLHRIKVNASPFVQPFAIDRQLTNEQYALLDRLGLSLDRLRAHQRKLQTGFNLGSCMKEYFASLWPEQSSRDVDGALYGSIIGNRDRGILNDILAETDHPTDAWERADFQDPRLPRLVRRFRIYPVSWHHHGAGIVAISCLSRRTRLPK